MQSVILLLVGYSILDVDKDGYVNRAEVVEITKQISDVLWSWTNQHRTESESQGVMNLCANISTREAIVNVFLKGSS